MHKKNTHINSHLIKSIQSFAMIIFFPHNVHQCYIITPGRLTVSQLYNKLEHHFWCDKHFQFQWNFLFSFFPTEMKFPSPKRGKSCKPEQQQQNENRIGFFYPVCQLNWLKIQECAFARRLDISY